MDFRIKCQIQKLLSLVPFSERMGYWFSRYITKNLTPSNNRFLHKINEGNNHYLNFEKYNQLQNNTCQYFEFGAGWTLTIPILMSRMGFTVNCIDIRKLIIPELIIDSISKFQANHEQLPVFKRSIPKYQLANSQILQFLKSDLDIHYNAPKDARNTGFENQYFDFISSTLTLCFIPKNDLEKILVECFRILKPGGVMSVTIDYQDNWSYIDQNITGYNFLQYDELQWKKYNPGIHFQNRLRHKDYLQLFEKAGFKVVSEKHRPAEEADLVKLRNLNIHSSFNAYTLEELGIKDGEIVVVKNR